MTGLQFVKDGIDDGLGQSHIQAGDSLARIGGLHGRCQLLVVGPLLSGELMHAALGQDAGIQLLLDALELLVVFRLQIQGDTLHHFVKGSGKSAGVIGGGSRLHGLSQFVAGANVVVIHVFLLSVLRQKG